MARTVLIMGPSGRGKSHSLKNMANKGGFVVINTERKSLPFQASAVVPQVRPRSVKETFDFMDAYLVQPTCKMIVVDSLSAFLDSLLSEARILKSGWDVFSYYNEKLSLFFEKLKQWNDAGKNAVVIAHDDFTVNELTGDTVISAKVKGKEWAGLIEKEFDIVFHAELNVSDGGTREYKFRTQTDGKVAAKSPEGMFDDLLIDNDLLAILKRIKEYDTVKPATQPVPTEQPTAESTDTTN